MKICNSCGNENGDNAKFCVECGEKLQESPKFCPECGIELVNQPKFCPECGEKINSSIAKKQVTEETIKIMDGIGEYKGIIPNAEIDSLWDAVRYGYIEEAEKFLKKGEEFDDDLICSSHDRNIVNLLVKYGARVDMSDSTTTILDDVIRNYDYSLDRFFENDKFDYDIFHSEQDIHNKYIGIIAALIKNGADPSAYNSAGCCIWTPLQYACNKKLTLLAKYLITICDVDVNLIPYPDYEYEYKQKHECGCDISEQDIYLIRNDSPLLFALSTGVSMRGNDNRIDYVTAKLLIENGADVTYSSCSAVTEDTFIKTTSIGNIISAISKDPFYEKNFEILELLLENGAELQDDDVIELYCIEDNYAKEKTANMLGIDLSALDETMEEFSASFIEDEIVTILDNWLPKIVKEQERWITKSEGTFELGGNPQRIQNALTKIGKGNINSEELLGFIDLSMMGKSGKEGILFTNEGIVFDNAFEKIFIPYKNMKNIYLKGHNLCFHKDTTYKSYKDGKNWYGMELTISDTYLNISELKECLNEIIGYFEQ